MKLTAAKIKELQKNECFNVQTLFNVKNQDLIDFIEDNDVCDMVLEILPKELRQFDIDIYSDGHIELS